MVYHIHYYVIAVSKVLHGEILDAKDSRSWESTAVKSKAELDNIRSKSIEMSEYFIRIFDNEVKALGYKLSSPLNTEQRGSRISFSHEESFRITKALMDRQIDGHTIVPDFRAPDNIRLGFAPLYNTFEEIYRLVEKLKIIIKKKLYTNYDYKKDKVT